jgi:hypothetical protein
MFNLKMSSSPGPFSKIAKGAISEKGCLMEYVQLLAIGFPFSVFAFFENGEGGRGDEDYFTFTSTFTSFFPSTSGTSVPSISFPSTLRVTLLPGPLRLTVIL